MSIVNLLRPTRIVGERADEITDAILMAMDAECSHQPNSAILGSFGAFVELCFRNGITELASVDDLCVELLAMMEPNV